MARSQQPHAIFSAATTRKKAATDAGNLSLRKITKAQRNAFYLNLVCGHLLSTVREALAVAPGIGSARTVAVRWMQVDSYGRRQLECMLACVLSRHNLEGIQWMTAHAPGIVGDAGADILMNAGRSVDLRLVT